MARRYSEGESLKAIINDAVRSGDAIEDVVATALRADIAPYDVVYTAIIEGFSGQVVVEAALVAGAQLNAVVTAATKAGASKNTIYRGALEAGESPAQVEAAMEAAGTQGELVNGSIIAATEAAPSSPFASTPAVFGQGGVVLVPSPPRGPAHLRVGALKVSPFIAASLEENDNVFYTAGENEKKRDSIMSVMPGLRLWLPFKGNAATLDYHAILDRYAKYREEDTSDQHAAGIVDLQPGNGFALRLSDTFERGHEARSSSVTGSIEEYFTNTISTQVGYRLTELAGIQIKYASSIWRFLNDTSHFRNRAEDRISGTVFLPVYYSTSALVEYYHQDTTYAEAGSTLDSRTETLQAGFAWRFSERSQGTIKAGFSRRDTKSTGVKGTVKVGSADVRQDFTTGTTVVLTARRSINEPNLDNIKYFLSTGGYAELVQRIGKKVSAMLRGSHVLDEYLGIRKDRTNLGGAGVKFSPGEWIDFAVDFNLRERHSHDDQYNYRDHSSIVTMSMAF